MKKLLEASEFCDLLDPLEAIAKRLSKGDREWRKFTFFFKNSGDSSGCSLTQPLCEVVEDISVKLSDRAKKVLDDITEVGD
ncbi:MAG: hypothetical protein JKY23_06620 [Nitrospinaceae bacterium]|nr:hypothetical protein [Nitrospinaceae bacterium]